MIINNDTNVEECWEHRLFLSLSVDEGDLFK